MDNILDIWIFFCLISVCAIMIYALVFAIKKILIPLLAFIIVMPFLGISAVFSWLFQRITEKRKEGQRRIEVEKKRQVKIEQERKEKYWQEKQRRERTEYEKIVRELVESNNLKRKLDERERFEDVKYECLLVVFASVDQNGKPEAIIRRGDNKFLSIERQANNTPFVLGETLRLDKEVTDYWNWYDEGEYKRRASVVGLPQKSLQYVIPQKNNWQDFQRVLSQNSISRLYHFTDAANLDSIIRYGGLFSWDYCNKHNIVIPQKGGGDLSRALDKHYGLEDYVRVSFTPKHPMMFAACRDGRLKKPIVLEISLDVCYFQDTRFSNMNATKNGHREGRELEDLKAIHFNTVKQINYYDLEESHKPYYQAEVLVKTRIPIKYIAKISLEI
ncbi:MAG: DarT ssDNA thymidine ADP-ribosyltransferase family protein [Cellulosilyticaceae bacterium]